MTKQAPRISSPAEAPAPRAARARAASRPSRRGFLTMASAAAMLAAMPGGRAAASVPLSELLRPRENGAATYKAVVALARARAAEPHKRVEPALSGIFDDLNYDAYRAIRPAPMSFGDGHQGLKIDFMPPGLIYDRPVSIAVVEGEQVSDVAFDPAVFEFDQSRFDPAAVEAAAGASGDMGYSGFRLRAPLNRPDHLDEVAVFQGASYLRAVARNTIYGLSARGLAIKTAEPAGEEFPSFTRFWIVKPDEDAQTITVRALLESASCTGAFEFGISPGDTTLMNVRATLFPRTEISRIGIAPLTSMYFFGPEKREGIDDYRDAVHDSSGLQMITGGGRRLWRALANPATLQVSAFLDENPQGFGLTQRQRDFDFYQDDEARYEKRPSAWIEPVSDWGRGQVILVEIPVDSEFHDNIVSFWRPETPLTPREEGHEFRYRIHWCATPPDTAPIARARATRSGAAVNGEDRRSMVVDFRKEEPWSDGVTVKAFMNGEPLPDAALRPLPNQEGMRVSFDFAPGDARILEFEVTLHGPEGPESETWLYRWTA